ncbi:MAG: diphthine synthase [Candidatus Pacearchaeota archaeon]
MLYLIGTGLDINDLNIKAIKALKKCQEIYLDIYTTKIPFSLKKYEKFLSFLLKKKIKIKKAEREFLEEKSKEFLEKAKINNIALLVYGDPLIATTHISLIKEAKELEIKTKIIHNISVINAITNTGLSIYKFGKIATMPSWQENYKPKSFYDIIKYNLSINAHTILLIDTDLDFSKAINQLISVDKEKIIKEIYICSCLGTKEEKIIKENIYKIKENIKKLKIKKPFCFIIPAELNFYENDKEILELALEK